MPCYQSTSLPSGVTTTGRTAYATEADCLNACKEGACCDGTTCSVKPQCQCQCTSNSCCGPDTMTVNGVTGPACRGGTESECIARGGVWRPCYGCSADANNRNLSICSSGDIPQASAPVFKGVGTTCASAQCCGNASGCLCYCTANGGTVPQYLNLTISAEWTGSASCNWSASDTITLTRNASYPIDSTGVGETFCHQYVYPTDLSANGFNIQVVTSKGTSHETMSIIWAVLNKTCPTYFRSGSTLNTSLNGSFQSTVSPSNGSGVCWSQHVNFQAEESATYGPGSLMPHVGSVLVRVKVNGVS
jgi:hypothetical protein